MRRILGIIALGLIGLVLVLASSYRTERSFNDVTAERAFETECANSARTITDLHKDSDWKNAEKGSFHSIANYNESLHRCFVQILGDIRTDDKIVPTKKIYDVESDKVVLECSWDVPDTPAVESCFEPATGIRTAVREDAIHLDAKYMSQ